MDHATLGSVRVVASPLHLSETGPTLRRAAPRLGADSGEVLAELGYAAEADRGAARGGGDRRMSTTNGIRYEVRDHVAWVTIDRPERMNALDPAAQDELLRTWGRIEGDRVGAGRGADRAPATGPSAPATT